MGLLYPGCNLINPEEPTPMMVVIPDITLQTNYGSEGSNSHKITDAWVYLGSKPVGVFELPAMVPIYQDSDSITVFAGIKANGISNTRTPYPMYTSHTESFSFSAATVDTVFPSIHYVEAAEFPILEDFESGNVFGGIGVTAVTNLVFEGNKSGQATLDVNTQEFVATSSAYILPGDGSPMYLEMNYRNSAPFDVFLRVNEITGGSRNEYALTVNTREAWNKIYVDLTSLVSANPGLSYQIVMRGVLPDGESAASFYWDNIKLVYL
jgi:hypothetical protein